MGFQLFQSERYAKQAGDHADQPEALSDLHLTPAHDFEVTM
jgi:hypothetical protein